MTRKTREISRLRKRAYQALMTANRMRVHCKALADIEATADCEHRNEAIADAHEAATTLIHADIAYDAAYAALCAAKKVQK